MILGELDWQKNESGPQLTPCTRINSKWIKDLNMNCDTKKIIEENIGSKISGISHSNIFAYISPREGVSNSFSLGATSALRLASKGRM